MPSKKTKYSIQVVVILAIFFFVLFNLIFRLVMDYKAEAGREKAELLEKERVRLEFITNIDDQYKKLVNLYDAREYEKAIAIIKVFNKYGKPDYEDLARIKKEIRFASLKKTIESISKAPLNKYIKLSEEIDIDTDEDRTIEVLIRSPGYGYYFYESDFPVFLEGLALSISGDFSENIIWSSNLDGELGTGKKIAVNLSIGEHQLTATCSNGITKGQMETKIYIEKDPEFLKKYKKKQ
jgi:hypothetical protein